MKKEKLLIITDRNIIVHIIIIHIIVHIITNIIIVVIKLICIRIILCTKGKKVNIEIYYL